MLAILGYDPNANPPDYGKIDRYVQNNTEFIKQEAIKWELRSKQIENSRKKLLTNLLLFQKEIKSSIGHTVNYEKVNEYLMELIKN